MTMKQICLLGYVDKIKTATRISNCLGKASIKYIKRYYVLEHQIICGKVVCYG